MYNSKQLKRVCVSVLLFSVLTASACFAEPLISGDFDENRTVSFGDLELLAQDWLSSSAVADMDGSGRVDFIDFSLFAVNWQKSVPALVINEFMASNGSTIADSQGDYDDWIEIYNTTNSPIDLAGMHITDKLSNLTKYKILAGYPSQTTVPAHGFLILWADEDVADGADHVGIKLSASGEDIALTSADGVTIIDSLTFGSQLVDISFGSYPDGSDQRRYFGVATPGAPNNQGYLGIVPTPVFSRDSGIFIDTFQLTISVDSASAVIRYTTDHSIPTGSSPVYTGPITISSTKEVFARAFEPGFATSEIEGKNFVKVNQEVANFSSNLPVIILDSFGYNIDAENNPETEYPYRNVYAVIIDVNNTGRATVADEPDCQTRGGMRVRGQTSAGFPKKQYKFESWDYMDDDKDVTILGMPADSDWVIHGPYADKTLIRNYLTYNLARDMGNYAVRTRLCEVFNNQNNGEVTYSDYAGVYVFMEKIKIGGDRLQSEKLKPTDNAEPEISGGYIIKQDKGTIDEPVANFFNTNICFKHLQYDSPDTDALTPAQKTWIKTYCDDLESALFGPNFKDPVNGYQKYLDPDTFVDYHIMVEIARNVDGYGLSDYMFKPRNGRIQRGPVWDYNLAWGNPEYRDGWLTEGWHYTLYLNPIPGDWNRGVYAWFKRLFEDENFYIRYIDRWFQLREGIFKNENILSRYDSYVDLLQESQQRNFIKWKVLGVDLWPNWFVGQTYKEETNWLRNWIYERFKWIESQFPEPPRYNQDGGQVTSGFELTIAPANAPYVQKFIDYNDSWSYLDDGSDQGAIWSTLNFVGHNNWPTAYGQFGFGGGDENTIINFGTDPANKYITTYFRKYFYVEDITKVQSLTAKLLRDGGAAIRLNSTILVMDNMPEGRLNYTKLAASEVDGPDKNTYLSHDLGLNWLVKGKNVLAVEVHLSSTDSPDMGFDCALEGVIGIPIEVGPVYYTTDGSDPRLHGGAVNPNAYMYTTPISLTKSTQVKSRELHNGVWSALNEAAFSVGPVKESLRITEIMYNPIDPNAEYIELKNVGSVAINLNLVSFTEGIDFTFGDYVLDVDEYVLVVEDIAAFQAKYGIGYPIAGQYTGSLDNAGERIILQDATGTEIHNFKYKDTWYDITDGGGFSLVAADEYSTNISDWDLKKGWRPSSVINGTPGAGEDASIPALGSIVINEVLAHSHATAPDWIELYNTTAYPINIGGWFLSDSDNSDPNMKKYEIAPGTIIGAYGYKVFYEDQHFGNLSDPGCNIPFALSEGGETAFLRSGSAGQITGYVAQESFGASESNVAFGRYEKSGGTFNFVAMSINTPGSANVYPKVGPVVINEVMYHPLRSSDAEYIELHNITSSPVTLQVYDATYSINVPWTLSEGISYTFPLGTTIPANGYLIVTGDIAAFNLNHGSMPAGVSVLGPYSGNLSNGGEKVDLMLPGDKMPSKDRYYIRVDRLSYSDGHHPENFDGVTDPWPTSPDGDGDSLSRINANEYGNDVINWIGQPATPGSAN